MAHPLSQGRLAREAIIQINHANAVSSRRSVCSYGSPQHYTGYYRKYSTSSPEHYIKVAERLAKETPNSFMPNQYVNTANPTAHYQTTGPEIWRQTGGRLEVFVCGMGTGGTISGTGRFLKEKKKTVRVVGVDPEGSIFYSRHHGTKEEPHQYRVEGIGEDFMPKTMDM